MLSFVLLYKEDKVIMIELKPISILDKEMVECINLTVTEEQYNYVASNSYSLAEAYDTNKKYSEKGEGNRADPYAVYNDGKMIGFVMIGFFPLDDEDYCDEPFYYIWRLFVDVKHQGKGFGTEILRLAMEKVKTKYLGNANWCFSSYVPENTASKRTFASYGFKEDGRILDGEAVCKISI